tara:strand:- start:392 stop:568 length:177 start_codon:yes stop_codon:yes gene_type:complete
MPEKMALNQQFVKHVLPLLRDDKIKPVVDRIFPIEEVGAAHTYMETNANFGKIILSVK